MFDRFRWQKRLSQHNEALKPVKWWDPQVRADPGGVVEQAQAVLLDLIGEFARATDEERRAMSRLVAEHGTFASAVAPPAAETASETLWRHLVHFALIDQYPDPRDAVLWLHKLCARPGVSLQKLAFLRREVAWMASDDDRYGFGSTRSMLLRGYGSYGKRGAPKRVW